MLPLSEIRRSVPRTLTRLAADPHVLLALALVFSAFAVEVPTGVDLRISVIPIVLYLVIQMATSVWLGGRRRSTRIDTMRLLLAVGAVIAISLRTGEVVTIPLFGLFIPIVAMAFDLDYFGEFNKQHGHATGDAVLRAFAAILTRRFRSSDLVARFGGEEFVAILDGANLDEGRRVADQVRRESEAAQLVGANREILRATVSAGCASLGPDVASFDTLLEVGLQMAKRGGRNRVVAA